MRFAPALETWFDSRSVRVQTCLIVLAAVIGADLMTLIFYSIFFADRLLMDLLLTTLIVIAVASPLPLFFLSRSARLSAVAAELDRANRVDDLTGLLNRKTFLAEAARLFETSEKGGCALLFIDIDHFKVVNDTKGHAAGDAVLRELGAVLKACSGEGDLAGRLGGEEFAMVLRQSGLRGSMHACDEIRRSLRVSAAGDEGGTYPVTVSIGVAVRHDGQDLNSLLAIADRNLYAAKANGRDRAVFPSAMRVVA